jgi:hypothetical protein
MGFEKKKLPPASFQLVFHPEGDKEYRHFAGAAQAPFDAGATAFSFVNAWWLADASLLAYWDAVPAVRCFGEAGLRAELIHSDGTQCYVASTNSFTIVAFRGTEPDAIQDVVTDARAVLVEWNASERVHGGFKEGLDKVWKKLAAALQALSTRPVWFSGHSLGAALATLAADRVERERERQGFGKVGGVYTFGSPLVGDRPFVDAFNHRFGDRSARFVNDQDIVTRVPLPVLGYRHVNNEHFVGTNDPELVLSEGLIDHTPRRYAVLVWNAFVDAGRP